MPSSVRQNTANKSLSKPLRRRGCCLTGCHERIDGRTDEGVCPYSVALSLIKGTPLSKQRRRSVDTKRAFPCNEKGVSSHRRNALFVCNQYYSRPSPFGEGTEERLLVRSYQPPSALLKTKEGMSHDIPSLLFLAILSIRASCRIRTNDPEITNHVLWPTELKRQVDKRFLSHRYNLLPLLCSQPGGFERSWS